MYFGYAQNIRRAWRLPGNVAHEGLALLESGVCFWFATWLRTCGRSQLVADSESTSTTLEPALYFFVSGTFEQANLADAFTACCLQIQAVQLFLILAPGGVQGVPTFVYQRLVGVTRSPVALIILENV